MLLGRVSQAMLRPPMPQKHVSVPVAVPTAAAAVKPGFATVHSVHATAVQAIPRPVGALVAEAKNPAQPRARSHRVSRVVRAQCAHPRRAEKGRLRCQVDRQQYETVCHSGRLSKSVG